MCICRSCLYVWSQRTVLKRQVFLIKTSKIEKGSAEPNKIFVATLTRAQLEEVAKIKLPDLNTSNLEKAIRIIKGTAKNMGIKISEK